MTADRWSRHFLILALCSLAATRAVAGERFLCAGALTAAQLEDEGRAAKTVQVHHEGTRSAVVVFAQFADEEPTPVPSI